MKDRTQHRAIYVDTTYEPASNDGSFIPYLSLEKKDIHHGINQMLTSIQAVPTHGVVLALIIKEELFSHQRVLHRTIGMGVKDSAIIYMPTACWRWMQKRVNGSGIINIFIMMFGTGIFLRHRRLLLLTRKEEKLMRQFLLLKQDLFFYLKERPVNLFMKLKKSPCHLGQI